MPEKLLTTEAGATTQVGRGVLQAVFFHNSLEHAVVRIVLDDGTNRFLRVNRDELRTTGLELVGSGALGPVEVSGGGRAGERRGPRRSRQRLRRGRLRRVGPPRGGAPVAPGDEGPVAVHETACGR
jgi:outer membrane receptor protein involved in Fe transport